MNKKIIVVPTYNESENIIELTNSLKKIEADIVFVDDNSPDKTQEIIKSHNQYNESIFLISRDRKDGYASACIEGIKYSIENKKSFIKLRTVFEQNLVTSIDEIVSFID